jgi:hypothetical protein
MHKVSLFNRDETDDRNSRMFHFTREIDKLIFDHQVRSQEIPVRIIMYELCRSWVVESEGEISLA